MKQKIIFIGFLTLLTLTFFILILNLKKDEDTTITLSYDESKYNETFENYDEININLDDINNIYKITKGGIYHFTGNLNGYISINTKDDVKIILDSVTITNDNGPCLYGIDSNSLYIELIGENILTDGANYQGSLTDVKGVIYSKDDVIIEGSGTLKIKANHEDGIVSTDTLVIKSGNYVIESVDDAIRGKDMVIILDGTFEISAQGDGIKSSNEKDKTLGNILILNGNFTITSTNDAVEAKNSLEIDDGVFAITTGGGAKIQSTNTMRGFGDRNNNKSSETSKGIKAENSIIIKNITLEANTYDDAIHCNGTVEIDGGNISITTSDDGIHADDLITILSGTIDIKQSYEGIEASIIKINGGKISIVASDDGINASDGSGSSEMMPGGMGTKESNTDVMLVINGGEIYVNADGDGLDSNGSIYIHGGSITVDGPTNDGNGPLDYDATLEISGGTLIVAGSSGMMQNATSSTQGTVLIYFSETQSAGTTVKIGDKFTYTPNKNFSCILVSSLDLNIGETYTITLNDQEYETFTLTSTISSIGNSSRSGMMNGMRR